MQRGYTLAREPPVFAITGLFPFDFRHFTPLDEPIIVITVNRLCYYALSLHFAAQLPLLLLSPLFITIIVIIINCFDHCIYSFLCFFLSLEISHVEFELFTFEQFKHERINIRLNDEEND